jgi:hypothetical protein
MGDYAVVATPEPAPVALLILGLVALTASGGMRKFFLNSEAQRTQV